MPQTVNDVAKSVGAAAVESITKSGLDTEDQLEVLEAVIETLNDRADVLMKEIDPDYEPEDDEGADEGEDDEIEEEPEATDDEE